VERIDKSANSQHSQREWKWLQDGLVAGEHGQDQQGCGIRPPGMQLEVRSQKAVLRLLLHGCFQAFFRALERSAVGGVDGRIRL
jgi:hypothetical protein